MGRPKKTAEPKKKEKTDPRIEEVYEEEVSFMCPVRGKVTQKVKIKRFKPLDEQGKAVTTLLGSSAIDELENKDDGLSIYRDGDLDAPEGESD
jgi:hypothetical protein